MGLSSVDPGSTRPAVTQIEYEAGNPPLSPEAAALLKSMFSAYDRVTVAQELGGGLTQSRVFVLHPRHRDGSTDLPLVVKIGPDWLIQHEQQAYQQFIRDKLSGRIELVQAATAGNWGGLGYRLAGDGQFKHESLTQFCRRPDPEVISHVLNDRLFKRLHTLWRNARVLRQAYSAAKYDLLLPVHLIIEPQPLPPDAAVHRLSPENLSDNHLTPGDFVQLAGFIITEVNLETKTVTLDLPDQPDGPPRSHRLRLQPVERPEQYRVNQSMPPVSGVVVQTRPIQLQGEARKALSQAPGIEMTTETLTLPTGQRLPNPLPYTSTLLADWPPVKLAYLHGDLNLENILVDPQTRDVTLIDFANAGEDHILHDLLHLETNVVIHLLPEALNEVGEPPDLIHSLFYERLHQAATADPTLWTAPDLLHPALKKIYLILAAIRQAAQPYLYDPHDWTEYQRGLALHLLGALKYKNLDTVPTAPLPKQLALLGAATALDLWQNSVERTILATQIERQARLAAHLERDLAGAFDGKVAQESIALPNGANLLNPLPQLPQLLDPWLGDHLACIHGDLRLDDILVELETNGGSLPDDVTHADYVLHHLLRLETGVVAGLLPPALGQAGLPPETIHFLFYERLHRAALADPTQFAPPKLLPPSLEKPYTLLATLRRQAGQILPTDEAWQMYYRGLVLYLLGLIKLKHQDTMPETQSLKRVVFLVATVAFDLYRKPHQRPLLEPPYKGLQSFQEADAPLFFGRETFVEQLVTEVQQQPLVVVADSSGSGKSSVVMAGLLPRLRQIGDWRVASFRPGSAPFEELVKALAPWLDLPDDEMVINRTVTALRQGATSLTDLLNPIYQRAHQSRLLLVADQFEELYTHCPDPATRHQFIDQLLAAVPPPSIGDEPTSKLESPLHLILTLRADFMGKVLTHRPFAEALQRAKVKLLGAMTRPELARVIEYPAETFGFSFEAGLVELILDDVGDEPGRLPLLEFALTLLWSLQDEGRLTAVAYDAIGRVKGAITYYAEHVYNDLNPDQQAEARRIFTQLVYPGVGTEDTRRIATKTELAADWPLVEHLADTRLIITNQDAGGTEIAEVVHEALIHNWGRLRQWLESDRAFRAWQERLRAVISQWAENQDDDGGLLRGGPLAEAETWLERRAADFSPAEQDFIHRSVSLRQQQQAAAEADHQRQLAQAQALAEEQRQNALIQAQAAARLRRQSIWLGVVVALLLLAVIATVFFGTSAQDALKQVALVENRQATAGSAANAAEMRQATAQAEQNEAQAISAQQTAAAAEQIAREAEQARSEAEAAKESALATLDAIEQRIEDTEKNLREAQRDTFTPKDITTCAKTESHAFPPPVYDGVYIWVPTAFGVTRISPSDCELQEFPLESDPNPDFEASDLVYGEGHIWIAGNNQLYKLDRSGNIVLTTTVQSNAGIFAPSLLYTPGALWVAADKLYKLEPATGAEINHYDQLTDQPVDWAYDGQTIWLANNDNTVARIDASTGASLEPVSLAGFPHNMIYADGYIWVQISEPPFSADNFIVKYQASTGKLVATFQTNQSTSGGFAVAGGNLWLSAGKKLIKLDADDGTQLNEIMLATDFDLDTLTFDGLYLWSYSRLDDAGPLTVYPGVVTKISSSGW